MDETVKMLYKCYLGKDKGRRIVAIWAFVEKHDGRRFFEKYSTPKDSILDYLKKADKILKKENEW